MAGSESGTARTMPGSIVNKQNLYRYESEYHPSTQTNNPSYTFTRAGHSCFCWVFWCTHFAWNSNIAVYSSLCTRTNLWVIYSGQIRRWFTLDKSAGDLRAPLFWPMRDKQYNLHEPRQPIRATGGDRTDRTDRTGQTGQNKTDRTGQTD